MSIIDNDKPVKITNLSNERLSEVMAAKIVKGRPYSCQTLKLSKGKEVICSKNKEEFSFDISKAD